MVQSETAGRGPRCVALIGPYAAGKTTLLESLLMASGAIGRKGSVVQGNTVGDATPEAREHGMSTELNVATATYLGDRFAFLDCPGSIEFFQDTANALTGVDAAIVVCEPEPAKAPMLRPYLKHLEDMGIPHLLFVNKIDRASGPVHDLLEALQSASARPLVLRQVPIMEGEAVTGYVDLASERAYAYRPNGASEIIDLPAVLAERKREARYQMLERLADFDDHLMEELLEEVEPPREEVFKDLTLEFAEGQIVPVLIGAAERDHGVRRLLKALRHEVPSVAQTAARLGVDDGAGLLAQVVKTSHTAHGGKLSIARILRGQIKEGDTVYTPEGMDGRVAGLYRLLGQASEKIATAEAGDLVALGRLDMAQTGDTLSDSKGGAPALPRAEVLPPVYALALATSDRKDEVKLTTAIAKICEEDPALAFEQSADTHELLLRGQGEIHLKVAVARLRHKYGLPVETRRPRVAYREAIRRPVAQRYRHKRQTGGHGQFADVALEIAPLPRGSGFAFTDTITGGVVPKQYIPAVEAGVRDALEKGPLGFPVVDVAVTLTDGSYHSVDSSDMAFRIAGRQAMAEALPKCEPILLEPVMQVEICVPSEATPKVNAIISSRRGQILGFDARPGWAGWDAISAYLPQAELHDLIVELRSATQGVGTFTWRYDHLAELTGKAADQARAAASAA